MKQDISEPGQTRKVERYWPMSGVTLGGKMHFKNKKEEKKCFIFLCSSFTVTCFYMTIYL